MWNEEDDDHHHQKGQKEIEKYIDHDQEKLELKVFDRFTIILQIFAKRTRSKVAKLQVPTCSLSKVTTIWEQY